ncbi:MAG: hypothetical protein HS101_13750 [Planctomycetia bacterium]|jgi:hypothetical protein|nr:hypothetical protein [Planctomycetia bacterium]MCC7315889.1 hypothetical protein [Planctomycetota bacterium]OQZ05164.1 MAG: hypothetical protein B6D36_11540 [Planctomycetes bacterium UTPLA1]
MAEKVSLRRSVRRFFDGYLTALGAKTPFARLIQQAVADASVRRKLVDSPQTTLAEAGVIMPDGLDVQIVENSDRVIHLVLPPLVSAQAQKGGHA